MALKKDTSFHGATLAGTYYRVDGLEWRKPGWEALVNVYASREAANPPDRKVGERVVTPAVLDKDGKVETEAVLAPITKPVIPEPIPGLGFRVKFAYVEGADPRKQAYEAPKAHLGGGESA